MRRYFKKQKERKKSWFTWVVKPCLGMKTNQSSPMSALNYHIDLCPKPTRQGRLVSSLPALLDPHPCTCPPSYRHTVDPLTEDDNGPRMLQQWPTLIDGHNRRWIDGSIPIPSIDTIDRYYWSCCMRNPVDSHSTNMSLYNSSWWDHNYDHEQL